MAKSSKQIFKDTILEVVVNFYMRRNKDVDRKSVEEYFSRLLRWRDGRQKVVSLLRSYKKSALQVDKELLDHTIELIYIVCGEF